MRFFHGTNKKFEKLSTGMDGDYENYGDAVYFANNFYAAYDGYGKNVFEIEIVVENLPQIDAKGGKMRELAEISEAIKSNDAFIVKNVADNSLNGIVLKETRYCGEIPTDALDFRFESAAPVKASKKIKEILGAQFKSGKIWIWEENENKTRVADQLIELGVELNIVYSRSPECFDVLVVSSEETLSKAIKISEKIK